MRELDGKKLESKWYQLHAAHKKLSVELPQPLPACESIL